MLSPGNKALVFCGIGKEYLKLTISLLYALKIFFPTRKSFCSLFHHFHPLGTLNHRDQKKLLLAPLSLNQKSQYSWIGSRNIKGQKQRNITHKTTTKQKQKHFITAITVLNVVNLRFYSRKKKFLKTVWSTYLYGMSGTSAEFDNFLFLRGLKSSCTEVKSRLYSTLPFVSTKLGAKLWCQNLYC